MKPRRTGLAPTGDPGKHASQQRAKRDNDEWEPGGRLAGEQAARRPAEARLREEIKRECERQRVALLGKEAADVQVRLLGDILGELICQNEFVTLLRAAGFPNVPRPVHQQLRTQACGIRADPIPAASSSDTDRRGSGVAKDMENATILTSEKLCARTLQALSRMTASRRLVVSSLMRAVDNYTGDFAHALLAATSEDQRATLLRPPRYDRDRTRSFARIEKRLIGFQQRNQVLSAGHNSNLIYLAVCCACVRSWMHCSDVVAWLDARYPRQAAALTLVATEANRAKEPKRPMKLPYTRDRIAGSERQTSGKQQRGRARAP
ncbi:MULTISPECIES: hypothetical protein [Paraburkholderia]|uniref:Uncharacterized protein n=1 Tax=Paraburkholderia madseniana TaxID=2599607 RepID=A0AAP5BL60_9BURK|nr:MULTISPECIES: hypothetical protein [Paraburkholderia]MCX4150772.1 hypothetical protein [Paraburkholderia madseniana]MDN7153705.1 hypothetical protein [Paraburkholderia sp. WS6]MDQ6412587.1 hypothetical protein [Paraburkholderia madseniana]